MSDPRVHQALHGPQLSEEARQSAHYQGTAGPYNQGTDTETETAREIDTFMKKKVDAGE